jgi:DNA-binding NarL/FixJ family response regulator
VVFDKDITDLLPALVDSYSVSSDEVKKLTEKDLNLMQLISEGYSNKEIAEKQFMGEGTVRNYISTILDKLQLRDRTQLAVFYIRHCEQERK